MSMADDYDGDGQRGKTELERVLVGFRKAQVQM